MQLSSYSNGQRLHGGKLLDPSYRTMVYTGHTQHDPYKYLNNYMKWSSYWFVASLQV